MNTTSLEINNFWFRELKPRQWFTKDTALDAEIKRRFGEVHQRTAQGESSSWRQTPEGRLAEILVLDQFSRNIFRDEAQAFACDPLALTLAQEAVQVRADKELRVDQRVFIYMPFMHSESKAAHETAVQLFSAPGLEYNLNFELRHKAIIDRFGRYPHRNDILGRASTPEEIEFLKMPGSSF